MDLHVVALLLLGLLSCWVQVTSRRVVTQRHIGNRRESQHEALQKDVRWQSLPELGESIRQGRSQRISSAFAQLLSVYRPRVGWLANCQDHRRLNWLRCATFMSTTAMREPDIMEPPEDYAEFPEGVPEEIMDPPEEYASGNLTEGGEAFWRQSENELNLFCILPPNVSAKRDVSISMSKKSIEFSIADATVVNGQFLFNVIPDDPVDWFVEDFPDPGGTKFEDHRLLVVNIRKAVGRNWPSLFESDDTGDGVDINQLPKMNYDEMSDEELEKYGYHILPGMDSDTVEVGPGVENTPDPKARKALEAIQKNQMPNLEELRKQPNYHVIDEEYIRNNSDGKGPVLKKYIPNSDRSFAGGNISCSYTAWWMQTEDAVRIVCRLPQEISVKRDVRVDMSEDWVSLQVSGEAIVEGQWRHSIVGDDTDWYVDDDLDGRRHLFIDVRKTETNVSWSGLLVDAPSVAEQESDFDMESANMNLLDDDDDKLGIDEVPFASSASDGFASGRIHGSLPMWWLQTENDVRIICQISKDVNVTRDVNISLTAQSVSFRIAREPVVNGHWVNSIDVQQSDWYVDDVTYGFDGPRFLIIDARKAKPGEDWLGVVEDVSGTIEPAAVQRTPQVENEVEVLENLDVDVDTLARLNTDDVVVLPDFVSSDVVSFLREDLASLHASRWSDVNRWAQSERGHGGKSKVDQIFLDENGALPTRDNEASEKAARFMTSQLVPRLKSQLAPVASIRGGGDVPPPFADTAELSYLRYGPGGFFQTHLDTPVAVEKAAGALKHAGGEDRRAFSFLLFLNDLPPADGGTMRVFPPLTADEQTQRVGGFKVTRDYASELLRIQPKAGTLVLYRSEAIPHEASQTRAVRDVLVGWLHRRI